MFQFSATFSSEHMRIYKWSVLIQFTFNFFLSWRMLMGGYHQRRMYRFPRPAEWHVDIAVSKVSPVSLVHITSTSPSVGQKVM